MPLESDPNFIFLYHLERRAQEIYDTSRNQDQWKSNFAPLLINFRHPLMSIFHRPLWSISLKISWKFFRRSAIWLHCFRSLPLTLGSVYQSKQNAIFYYVLPPRPRHSGGKNTQTGNVRSINYIRVGILEFKTWFNDHSSLETAKHLVFHDW